MMLLSSACQTDALYTYCDDNDQCGVRRYDEGDVEVRVPLECIEAVVRVSPDRVTRGNLCTLACASDSDCDSRAGFALGRCIRWSGDDEAFCYAPCQSPDDCYPSSTCEEVRVDAELVRVCLPGRV